MVFSPSPVLRTTVSASGSRRPLSTNLRSTATVTPPAVSAKTPAVRANSRIPSRISPVVKRVLAVDFPCETELIVVDDGSQDGTGEALTVIDDPRMRLLRHPRNRGKGAAVRTAAA